MKILFARHAESEANLQHVISNRDIPHRLTPAGAAQAAVFAETLDSYQIVRILSSPILRAQETAGVVAKRLGLPLVVSPALREFDCGMMEGRGDAAAWAAHRELTRAWEEEQDYQRRIPPDGESYNDLKARFLPFITSLTAQNRRLSGDLLLVSHGAVLYQMLPLILENVDRAFTRSHPLEYCGLIVTHPVDGGLVCERWAGLELA